MLQFLTIPGDSLPRGFEDRPNDVVASNAEQEGYSRLSDYPDGDFQSEDFGQTGFDGPLETRPGTGYEDLQLSRDMSMALHMSLNRQYMQPSCYHSSVGSSFRRCCLIYRSQNKCMIHPRIDRCGASES